MGYETVGHGKLLNDPSIQSHYPAYRIILSARTLSFYFYLLSGIIFVYLFYLLNITILCPLFLLIFLSPYVFSTSILAQSDGLLLLTVSLCTLLSTLYLKHPKMHLLFIILNGIVCGLALSTKLNGGITIFIGILSIFISTDSKKKLRSHAPYIFILLLITFAIFVILNPNLYVDTFQGIGHIFQYRINMGKIQNVFFPTESLPTSYIPKFIVFSKQLYSFVGFSQNLSLFIVFFSTIISMILIIANLINKIKISKLESFQLTNSFLIFTAIFQYIPMNWSRYYLPALIENVLLVCIECHLIPKFFPKKLYQKPSISKISNP